MPALLDKTLLYVTGKGGVGKTTVAAALGLAGAAAGRRTLVCEVAEQDRMSRAFAAHGVRPGHELALADGLWATTIDPQVALEEWLGRQLGGVAAVRALMRSSAFQYFVAAAPGVKELITIAKVWELAQPRRWNPEDRTYDLVVVDAPASGHGLAMLATPQTFGDIARVGPIRRQADKVRAMLTDPARTGYVAVALPEELPVAETLELGARLEAEVGLGLDVVIVNALEPERLSRADADALKAVAAESPPVRAALRARERARGQRVHLRRLRREAGAPVLGLPFLFAPELGLAEYGVLARELARRLPDTGAATPQRAATPAAAARA